jgi:hypothetical protein
MRYVLVTVGEAGQEYEKQKQGVHGQTKNQQGWKESNSRH